MVQINEQKTLRHNSNGASLPDEAAPTTKQKLVDASIDATNLKLQEFLTVMQPPSKSKVWANEDTIASGEESAVNQENITANLEDYQSDDQYQPVPKKRKKSAKDAPDEDPERSNKAKQLTTSKVHEPVPAKVLAEDTAEEEVPKQLVISESTASDVDWIRSRTSRLLGLVDDDEDGVKLVNDSPLDAIREIEIGGQPQLDTTQQTSDAGSQTDDEILDQNEATALPVEETISTARLFVRNLSYNTSQADLRDYFGQHGAVSEVRELGYSVDAIPLWHFCDEQPDRDSLCFACDAIRKSILVDISRF